MILTDKKIREKALHENLIEPFQEVSLQSESYDLHIGERYYTINKENGVIDLLNERTLDKLYVEELFDEKGYTLSPKEFLLVSLKEKLTIPEGITAHIRPRTRLTRAGLQVLPQHCNSTYSGILKIGICNLLNIPIKIYKDLGLCQIIFERLEENPSSEKLYKNKKNAAYQNEESFVGFKIEKEVKKELDKMVRYYLGE